MKTITITPEAMQYARELKAAKEAPVSAKVAAVKKGSSVDRSAILAYVRAGATYSEAFLMAAAEKAASKALREASKAVRAESWTALPEPLAAAVAADYATSKATEGLKMRDFIAYRIAQAAKGDPAAMRATEATIEKLTGLYLA